jgi:hypothetical protein
MFKDFKSNIIKKQEKKIQSKQKNELDQSYAFIEYEKEEDKIKILNESNRVLGVYFDKKSHKLDNADYKTMLKIKNIGYGSKLCEIMEKINNILKANNIPTFYLDDNHKSKLVTVSSFILEFQDFQTSLRALILLNNLRYKNRPLKVNHLFTNLFYHNNKLKEFYSGNKNKEIELKLKELRQREIIRNQKLILKYGNNEVFDFNENTNEDFEEEFFFENKG